MRVWWRALSSCAEFAEDCPIEKCLEEREGFRKRDPADSFCPCPINADTWSRVVNITLPLLERCLTALGPGRGGEACAVQARRPAGLLRSPTPPTHPSIHPSRAIIPLVDHSFAADASPVTRAMAMRCA